MVCRRLGCIRNGEQNLPDIGVAVLDTQGHLGSQQGPVMQIQRLIEVPPFAFRLHSASAAHTPQKPLKCHAQQLVPSSRLDSFKLDLADVRPREKSLTTCYRRCINEVQQRFV